MSIILPTFGVQVNPKPPQSTKGGPQATVFLDLLVSFRVSLGKDYTPRS